MSKEQTEQRYSVNIGALMAPSLDTDAAGQRRGRGLRESRVPVQPVHIRRPHLQRAREHYELVPGIRPSPTQNYISR